MTKRDEGMKDKEDLKNKVKKQIKELKKNKNVN
jgi:hypothetical protein